MLFVYFINYMMALQEYSLKQDIQKGYEYYIN